MAARRRCWSAARDHLVSKLEESIAALKYDSAGLIPAVCVDCRTKQVLMVAYMNRQSLLETIRTGKTHFWSRSRKKSWMKGESSGHTQEVRAICTDCDSDALVIEVKQNVAACHEGYYSCFYRRLDEDGQWQVVAQKLFDPEKVYHDKSQ